MQSQRNPRQLARRFGTISQKTYALTSGGKVMFQERLNQLARLRTDLFEQIRALKEEQADEPFDLASRLSEMQQIDNEMYRLEAILSRAEPLKPLRYDTVEMGSKVTLTTRGQQLRVVLVDSVEADPSNGFISNQSPIGQLLFGRHLDETVVLKSPRVKHQTYRIVAIEGAAE